MKLLINFEKHSRYSDEMSDKFRNESTAFSIYSRCHLMGSWIKLSISLCDKIYPASQVQNNSVIPNVCLTFSSFHILISQFLKSVSN